MPDLLILYEHAVTYPRDESSASGLPGVVAIVHNSPVEPASAP